MDLIQGEIYRLTREKIFRKYLLIILITVVCCFGMLLIFEKDLSSFSNTILEEFKGSSSGTVSYNFGLFKIWDIESSSTDTIGHIFCAIMASGNMALLIGLFCGNYIYVFRKKTALFLESCRRRKEKTIGVIVLMEIIISNFYLLFYEVCLGGISTIYGGIHNLDIGISPRFWIWILCIHINITAFALLSTAIMITVRSKQIGILLIVSLVFAGSSCMRMLRLVLHLPDLVSGIWILNNISYLPWNQIGEGRYIYIFVVALVTMLVSVALIVLEMSINGKERYR